MIDKDLLKDLKKNEIDLFYRLKSDTRRDIIDLLVRNVSLIVLNDTFFNPDKDDLIKKNNDLFHLLINLKTSETSVEYFGTGDKVESNFPYIEISNLKLILTLFRKQVLVKRLIIV